MRHIALPTLFLLAASSGCDRARINPTVTRGNERSAATARNQDASPQLALVADSLEQLPLCSSSSATEKPEVAGRIAYVGAADSKDAMLYACLQRADAWAWARLPVSDATDGNGQGPKGDEGPVGLKGDKGDVGLTGPVGSKGDKGDPGIAGSQGNTGATGPQGPTGLQGPQGATGTSAPVAFGADSGAIADSIYVAASGNVGIGTTSPSALLEVAGSARFKAGSSTASFSPSGLLTGSTTVAQTDADTNEKTLWTYSLPAGVLNTNNTFLRITVFGRTGATGNCKTTNLYFGGVRIGGVAGYCAGGNNSLFHIVATVARTGAGNQTYVSDTLYRTDGIDMPAFGDLTLDDTAPITISFSGQNFAADAGDVVFKGAFIEVLK